MYFKAAGVSTSGPLVFFTIKFNKIKNKKIKYLLNKVALSMSWVAELSLKRTVAGIEADLVMFSHAGIFWSHYKKQNCGLNLLQNWLWPVGCNF